MPLPLERRSGDLIMLESAPRPGHVRYHSEEALNRYERSEDNKQFDRRMNMAAPPPYEAETINPSSGSTVDQVGECRMLGGLAVPTRLNYITSGFKFPVALAEVGMSKPEWSAFTSDIKQYASLSSSQWFKIIGGGLGTFVVGSIFISWFAVIPAAFVGHRMRKDREHLNLLIAYQSGLLDLCLKRWNESYFKPKGLLVQVHMPGMTHGMTNLDVASSHWFRQYQTSGDKPVSAVPGSAKDIMDGARGPKYESKADRVRRKAIRKGRIVIMLLDQSHLNGAIQPSDSPQPLIAEDIRLSGSPPSPMPTRLRNRPVKILSKQAILRLSSRRSLD